MHAARQQPTSFYQTLIDLIGEALTLALCRARPGIRVYVPFPETLSRRPPGSRDGQSSTCHSAGLVGLIGWDAAKAMAKLYGGTYVVPPTLGDLERTAKHAAIAREHYGAGKTSSALAMKYGYTQRHIERILSRNKPSGRPAN